MKLSTKLAMGLGFLFFIIFAVEIAGSYYIQKLAKDSDNILKDNYDSITYAKNMLSALDEMKSSIEGAYFNSSNNKKFSENNSRYFETNRIEFEKNLKAENSNITEIQEQDYVDTLNGDYNIYLKLLEVIKKGADDNAIYFNEFLPLNNKLKKSITSIYDVNLQAVVRKSQITQQDAGNMIRIMAIIGSVCIFLAFCYFRYFPFYISTTISYLADKMKELLKDKNIALDIKSNDEALVMLSAINLLKNDCAKKEKKVV
jgi:hypothetical protein